MSTKAPNPVDKYVGSRVRMRRIMLGMSQEKLGEQMGLTFQQIQKYERGINRVSASRLYELGRVLGVTVQFFFDEVQFAPNDDVLVQPGFAESGTPPGPGSRGPTGSSRPASTAWWGRWRATSTATATPTSRQWPGTAIASPGGRAS